MSKGITKIQLALSVAKGKRIELVALREHMDIANIPFNNSMSGSGRVRTVIEGRIKELDQEIKEIEGNVPTYRDMQQKGLIS